MTKAMKKMNVQTTRATAKAARVTEKTYKIDGREGIKMMKAGSRYSRKIVKAMSETKAVSDVTPGPTEAAALAYGLAKATQLLMAVMKKRGYDVSQVYEETSAFFTQICQTEEFDEYLQENGL